MAAHTSVAARRASKASRKTSTLPTPFNSRRRLSSLAAHLISRSWLDLDALRAPKECSLPALSFPALRSTSATPSSARTPSSSASTSRARPTSPPVRRPRCKALALKELNLSSCHALRCVSKGYWLLSSLRLLKLESLPRVTDLVSHLEKLSSLRWLSLAGCSSQDAKRRVDCGNGRAAAYALASKVPRH